MGESEVSVKDTDPFVRGKDVHRAAVECLSLSLRLIREGFMIDAVTWLSNLLSFGGGGFVHGYR